MSAVARIFRLRFEPAGRDIEVAAGTLLDEAARLAGLDVPVPCGGQGRCGRCLVRVEEGTVERRQNAHLSAKQVKEGWALACQAEVVADAIISIPSRRLREEVVQQTADRKAAVAARLEGKLSPPVQRLFLEMPPPTLQDNASDADRLRRELWRQHGFDNVSIDLALLRSLDQVLRDANWQVTAILEPTADGFPARLLDLRPGDATATSLGVAVDIGTTTVVVDLVDMASGHLVDTAAMYNRQVAYGEDVISRIIYSRRRGGAEHLRRLVTDTINELLVELTKRNQVEGTDICAMVAAGNTTMIHLFLGLNAQHLREEPYAPVATHFPVVTAGELGLTINPRASVYCVPAVAAYVGGDITAGVLTSGAYQARELTLFMDVGTNGEMVLGNADWLLTCACSAGPAFEGAGVRCGMRASAGAIDEVKIHSQTLEPTIRVIGDRSPLGICGSGMISALAEMFITGIVDRAGRVPVDRLRSRMKDPERVRWGEHGGEYVIVWAAQSGTGEDIVLTEVDINNLIRTKAAIYAGITVMLRSVGIGVDKIEQVLIGGAFGQHINVEEAIQIGLLPDMPWEKFHYLGNTSVQGARQILLSRQARQKAREIAGKMTYLELIADNTFMNEYTSALFLPHTDRTAFPSVEALLKKPAVA